MEEPKVVPARAMMYAPIVDILLNDFGVGMVFLKNIFGHVLYILVGSY